jgi:hypothetical protein
MATRVATLQLESLGERGAWLRNALLKIQRQTKCKFVVILQKSIHSLTLNKNHSKLHRSWIESRSKLESYFPSNIPLRHEVRHFDFPCQFRNWPVSTSQRKRQTVRRHNNCEMSKLWTRTQWNYPKVAFIYCHLKQLWTYNGKWKCVYNALAGNHC